MSRDYGESWKSSKLLSDGLYALYLGQLLGLELTLNVRKTFTMFTASPVLMCPSILAAEDSRSL